MRANRGIIHILYTWTIVGLAVWQLSLFFPALELDKARELLAIVFLGVLAEWLAVSFPHGQLSGGFALVLSTFLIYGAPATAWVSGLATIFGQGIANKGNPLRTTLFNGGQYVLAASASAYLFKLSGGIDGLVAPGNILPLAVFTFSYIVINHLLVYFYLLPSRRGSVGWAAWTDTLSWDGLTYLFTIPLGLVIAMIYSYIGLTGTLMLFSSVLALQFILRYYVKLQVTNRELTAFYKVARFLEGNPDPRELLELILLSAKKAFPYHTGLVFLCSEDKDTYLLAAAAGPFAKQLVSTVVYQGEGVIGWCLLNRRAEIIYDSRDDHRTRNEAGLCQVMRSLLIIPLLSGKEVLGVVVLGDKHPHAFDEKHLHIMAVLGGQAAIAVENSVLNYRLSQAKSRDSLTGLLSLTSLYEMSYDICINSYKNGSSVGLVLIDLDRFKLLNQIYGRDAGELVLAELATLIEGITRKDDIIARFGGDEFAVLLPGAEGPRLLDIAETLWKKIREHSFLQGEGRAARVTASLGLAEFPRDGADVEELFSAALRALEKAKAGGRDRVDCASFMLVE